MKQCSACSTTLQGEVLYCPFCGEGTDAAARKAKEARAVITPPVEVAATPVPRVAPVVPAAPAVPAAPVTPRPAVVPAPAAVPAAAPRPATPQPAAPSSPVTRKGGKGKWIVGGIALALVLLYSMGKKDEPVVVEKDRKSVV